MESHDSVTQWIKNLKTGDEAAVEQLWERYFRRMVGLARKKLSCTGPGQNEAEDAALSAFKSLWLGATKGRFPLLTDREGLWPLLAVLTSRKARDQVDFASRQKRGGGNVRREADLPAIPDEPGPLGQIFAAEPTPDMLTQMSEECERLLGQLDETCRKIACLKLEGYTNDEIVPLVGLAPRSVERKLKLIRETWQEHVDGLASLTE